MLPLRSAFATSGSGQSPVGSGFFDERSSENRGKASRNERRVTDQVISRWEKAPTKFQMLQRLIGSRLWEHCFLLIPDDEFSFSAVVGYGSSAMLALGLTEGQINSIQHVPRYLRIPLGTICTDCLIDNTAHDYNGTADVAEEDAIYRFRMAAMPVSSPIPEAPGAPSRTSYILGVLTYQTVH
ncbi:MAG: hypothetical protein O3A51_10015 [Verrucomicrobia bacterium]|nr:hypothetical protein [Verrucomicrobiota bacterium]